jgi:hypothetical protein
MCGTASINICNIAGGGNVHTLSACMHTCLQPNHSHSQATHSLSAPKSSRVVLLSWTTRPPVTGQQSPALPHTHVNQTLDSANQIATRTLGAPACSTCCFLYRPTPTTNTNRQEACTVSSLDHQKTAMQVQAVTTTLTHLITHLTGHPSKRGCTQVNVGIWAAGAADQPLIKDAGLQTMQQPFDKHRTAARSNTTNTHLQWVSERLTASPASWHAMRMHGSTEVLHFKATTNNAKRPCKLHKRGTSACAYHHCVLTYIA